MLTKTTSSIRNKLSARSKTSPNDDELQTSISSFQNIMNPKFIEKLEGGDTKQSNGGSDDEYSTSINLLPVTKEKTAFSKFKKKPLKTSINGNTERKVLFLGVKATPELKRRKQNNFSKKNRRKSIFGMKKREEEEEIKANKMRYLEVEMDDYLDLPQLELTKFYSSQNKNNLSPEKNRKRRASRFEKPHTMENYRRKTYSHKMQRQVLNQNAESQNLTLRSFNDGTGTDLKNVSMTSCSSFQNRIFDGRSSLSPSKNMMRVMLMEDGQTQLVDLREILDCKKQHKGILKYKSLRTRRQMKRLMEKLGDEEQDKKLNVKFGKIIKVFKFNPKTKVGRRDIGR